MNILSINPDDIDQLKLSLISFGSLGGIGIGLLFSMILSSNLTKIIVSLFFLGISLWMILKNIHLLMR